MVTDWMIIDVNNACSYWSMIIAMDNRWLITTTSVKTARSSKSDPQPCRSLDMTMVAWPSGTGWQYHPGKGLGINQSRYVPIFKSSVLMPYLSCCFSPFYAHDSTLMVQPNTLEHRAKVESQVIVGDVQRNRIR